MPEAFAATDWQLVRDQARKLALLLAIPMALAIAWIAWMLLARITVHATTDQARTEVAQAVYYVQAPVSGRVTQSYLELGRQVDPGTVLVELEGDPQRLRVQEEETHHTALQAQLEELHRQKDAEQRALVAERAASRFATEQERANLAGAQEVAQLAQEEFDKRKLLYEQGIVALMDFRHYESDLKKKKSELQSARTGVSRAGREQLVSRAEREARIEALNGDIGRIEGELATSSNTVQQLEYELGWHRILASGRGRLGEIVSIKPGAYVREGDRLATIIPDGQLRIVAYFEPRIAIGLVKPGQIGRLRLDGFPWAEYGSVTASVTSVGSEVRDGRVRVELDPQPHPRLVLQHGLTGTLEIQTERISPASLLLRKSGGYLGHPGNSQVASP
jgi:membrane fusion protein (multidrug efflux system)